MSGSHIRDQHHTSRTNPHDADEGRLLYTDKSSKTTTYDADGNVLDVNIEQAPRQNAPGYNTHDDTNATYGTSTRSSQAIGGHDTGTGHDYLGMPDSSYTRQGRMATDDSYGQTGASQVGNEQQRNIASSQREAAAQHGQASMADKLTGQREKAMGKMTSDSSMFTRGEERVAGKFQPK